MEVILPKLGLTMTEGTVTEWLKQPGDVVWAEEPLCTYETEKVTLELPAPAEGMLEKILVQPGATVPAGTALCVLQTEAEVPARPPDPPQRPTASDQAPAATTPEPLPPRAVASEHSGLATPLARALARRHGVALSSVTGRGPLGRVQAADVLAAVPKAAKPLRATPLARRVAVAEGLDLSGLRGTGPEGTVTRGDVEAARRPPVAPTIESASVPPRAAGRVIPHTAHRRKIAERMAQSAFTAPHVTLTTEAEATNLVAARSQLNEELPQAERISYNTLLAALTAKALAEHPNLNARWEDDGVHLAPEINIALAVDTERGLLTPVLQRVDQLSLTAIQEGYNELTSRALAGRSLPDDLAGGTFTITNLGGLDIDAFTPIINPPQAAILGIGRIVEKPVAHEGAVAIRPTMVLSLSFDHRVVDGAPAARFLQRVKQLVERPMALLLSR